MSQTPTYDLDAVRQSFPIAQHLTYLNHASISPIPLVTQQAMDAVTARLVSDPQSLFVPSPDDPIGDLFGRFPAVIADLINAAHPSEIVGLTSTSMGINAVAQAIQWQAGDNVVLSGVEFPSNAYPWMALERRGVAYRLAPAEIGGASLAALEPLVDDHTRVIAVSAVQFFTGHRADLAQLGAFCRARGIILAVDAIQAIGHMPFDVQAQQIDILAAGGQKSLMAPPGQGFLYVRQELAEQMIPNWIGPNAVEGWEHWLHYDMTPREGATRFMMGTPNMPGMAGVIASIGFLRDLGLSAIDAWTRHLSAIAIDDLTARGYTVITPPDSSHYGPIVTFRINGTDQAAANARADELLGRLNAAGVRLTKHLDAAGAPHLRIATHCYNTEDDVRRVGQIVGDNTP